MRDQGKEFSNNLVNTTIQFGQNYNIKGVKINLDASYSEILLD